MYLCINNGKLYVTNAPEKDLKLAAIRNPAFHFEPIEYAPADSIKPEPFQPDPVIVKKMAKRHPVRAMFTTAEAEAALDDILELL